jgi:hypothetical protein
VLRAVWQHLAVPFAMHNQKVLAVLIGLLEDLNGQGGLVGDEDDDDNDALDADIEAADAPEIDDTARVAGASNPRVQKQLRRMAILCAKDAIKCALFSSSVMFHYVSRLAADTTTRASLMRRVQCSWRPSRAARTKS